MTKSQFIKNLSKDDTVQDVFAVKRKDGVKPYAKGHMFTLLISDKTGNILVKFWGGEKTETDAVFSSFETNDAIFIKGKVSEYKDNPEIHVNPPDGEIKKTDAYDLSDFIADTKRDINNMIKELKEIVADIKDPHIKQLINSFVDDEEFMKKFSKAPAARSFHHDHKGGLLEHIMNLIKISQTIVKIYPDLNKDLLIAGCIFHDIGKLVEYEVKTAIELTMEGSLFGHISIGQKMVLDRIEKIENFPEKLKQKIIHMILSHHGKQAWGSPIVPQIPEAVAFHYIDNCDAKVNHVMKLKENDPEIKVGRIWNEDDNSSTTIYFD